MTQPVARALALALLLLVATLFAVSHMDQGIDTWISLAGGRDVMTHGVRDSDPFSFQSRQPYPVATDLVSRVGHWLQPHGWINQNWLTHVLFYKMQGWGGLDALVVWKLLNYLLVAIVLAGTGRVLGASWTLSVFAACAGLVTSRSYLSMRAQDLSNLAIAVLVLILVLAERRDRRWVWALVPLFAVWANAHGGFIYGFILMAVVVAPDLLRARRSGSVSGGERRRLMGLVAAGAAALLASIALSPYRLANLTHPLVISVSANAPQWRVVREWRPLFSSPVASPLPFAVFALIAGAALAAYAKVAARPSPDRVTGMGLSIGAVSFALALTSGRFVPIASVAVAPFLAFWLDGVGLATVHRTGLASEPGRHSARLVTDALLWVVLIACAAAFVPRALRTYADPWPQDARRSGLFDRMTFSHQRPWDACAFLAANAITGRMWNYWDEGGFLAFCQQPDAASGRVPVELFIDGRAQAAYDVSALGSYLELLNGTGFTAAGDAGEPAPANLAGLRAGVAGRLRDAGVWLVLVPASHQNTVFARAAVGLPGWKLVYIDPGHSLFVDTANAQGRLLVERVASGGAHYPDMASAKLTAAFRLMPPASEEDERKAVGLARESYLAEPSTLAVLCAVRAARSPTTHRQVVSFLNELTGEFTTNRERYRTAAGYAPRLDAVSTALSYLAADAETNKQTELRRRLGALLATCRAEQEELLPEALW
jgi:hypothetical protein